MSMYTVDSNDSRLGMSNIAEGHSVSPDSNENLYDNDGSKAYGNESPNGSATNNVVKKRRGSTRSRVVSNLTTEQLQRKRQHDRDAQRAIRQRTKSQISALEEKIQELEEQREAIVTENEELRKRLDSILDILETLLRQDPLDVNPRAALQAQAIEELNSTARSGHLTPSLQDHRTKLIELSVPSPGIQQTQHLEHSAYADHASISAPQDNVVQDHNLPGAITPNASERLTLDYVLQGEQRKLSQNGHSPVSERSSMEYAHKSPSVYMPSSSSSNGSNTLIRRQNIQPQYCNSPTIIIPTYRNPIQHPFIINTGSSRTEYSEHWQALPRHMSPTCPLDIVFIDFIEEQAKLAAIHGITIEALAGPPSPDITLVVMPKTKQSTNPLTEVLSAILDTYEERSIALPERIAILYILYVWMRWAINPTKEAYERMPEWILPGPSALFTPHPIWMDHVPWPKARDIMVRNASAYPNVDFSFPYTQSLSVNWPYEDMDTVLEHAPGEFIINPVFERHLRNLENWSLGTEFASIFSDLRPHIRVKG